jgi:GAF domain-containing protein
MRNQSTARTSFVQDALDRITHLAAQVLDVPDVCVSLVDTDGNLLVSCFGLPAPAALLLSYTFRSHVGASRRPLVVVDGRLDPLVARNPAVRDGTVRACVGMPLRTADGRLVGTLMAMDSRARVWTLPQIALLAKLSVLIVDEMELGTAVRRAS